jgi:type I restriction enzyme M protein
MFLEVQIKDNKIFAPLKNKWLMLKPEEKVRQEYICRLVNNYGYSLDQIGQEIQVSNSQRGQGRAMADIVVWRNAKDKNEDNNAFIVVECKAEHITIREDDYFQGYNYASWAGADFFVTSNLKETRIFRVIKGKMPKRLEEIIDIPKATIANNAKKVDELLKQTKVFTRDEFSKLLFKCHNIIRNNDKLSPEAAFDEISKILFIKIRYERSNSEAQIFSKDEFKKARESYNQYKPKDGSEFYQFLFEQTKYDFKNDDLFDQNDMLKIRENSFEAIVEELQIYNLSTTSDDVKGIAFEQFLGKTFRGELGQFFTPRTIVNFMTKVLDPEEGEKICDPCCGSGGFLIKAFEYVREKIELEIHKEKERIKTQFYTDEYEKLSDKEKEEIDLQVNNLFSKLNAELDINNPKSRLRVLSYDCIYGTDANPRMSRTAKMNMIMHGDGHGGVHHNDGLLNVNGIFENRFDIILTNPPFGSHVEKTLKITEADKYKDAVRIAEYTERYGDDYIKAMGQINNNINKSILSLYKTGSMSTLTEVLFIERCVNLLKPGGRVGIVLPEGVLNNTNLQKIREFIESKAKILLIISIPQDVFIASGATVKPSLLFFKKFTEDEAKQYASIKKKAEKEIETKYKTDLDTIAQQLSEKGKTTEEKKILKAKQKDIETQMEEEIKDLVKARFDYQVPLAEVEKAGISTTGAEIENELEPLEVEYTTYRKANKLWTNTFSKVTYQIMNAREIYRIPIVEGNIIGEPEVFYEKEKPGNANRG